VGFDDGCSRPLSERLPSRPGSAPRPTKVAYLVNVTVRPGYNFANADAAIAYGPRGFGDKDRPSLGIRADR